MEKDDTEGSGTRRIGPELDATEEGRVGLDR